MKTIMMIISKRNVSKQVYDQFFEFVNPFMESKNLHLITIDPKIYVSEEPIPENVIRELKNKLRNQGNYTRVVQSVYFGRLNKL